MKDIIIAAAQSGSVKGEIEKNVKEHLRFIEKAAENNVDFIIFPELSLTGYEPEIAKDFSFVGDEKILNPLKEISEKHNISIVAGGPIKSGKEKPYIGSFIIQPGKEIELYRKRYLHPPEAKYFMPSEDNKAIKVSNETIGIAICADIDNPQHPMDAKNNSATIYAAGVLMSVTGIDDAHSKMSSHAFKHSMTAIMANYAYDSGGYQTGKRSGIWCDDGEVLVLAENYNEALVIGEKIGKDWTGKIVEL